MYLDTRNRARAFSLIELVIVIVIIGVISAIAIPRMTRGASNAGATALRGSLSVMRGAIELYRAEHEGRFPTAAKIADQLTMYTKLDGTDANALPSVSDGRIYGPYLRNIPPLPVGREKNSTTISASAIGKSGWVYDDSTGTIVANTTNDESDQDGFQFNTY